MPRARIEITGLFLDYNPAGIISFMRRLMICFVPLIFLLSCTSQTPSASLQTTFTIYRFDPPSFVEFSQSFQEINEIPFSVPLNCQLLNTFPAPVGKYLLIELNCPNGQTVLFLDTDTGSMIQPITDADSHFLSWTTDGKATFLKVDSLGTPHVVRVDTAKNIKSIPVTEFTYDLAANPSVDGFILTFSRGLGQGSELWLADRDGKTVRQLYADPFNYLSFARYSPDGDQIAFIKIPDTQTPFTVGELWAMNADGSSPRKLADADAGHGYAASWSPDGKRIAFVIRENPEDEHADQSSDSLISNIYTVDVGSGTLKKITDLNQGHVETPFWSPDGNTLAFTVVINDRMQVRIADLRTSQIRSLVEEPACCPAWIRK